MISRWPQGQLKLTTPEIQLLCETRFAGPPLWIGSGAGRRAAKRAERRGARVTLGRPIGSDVKWSAALPPDSCRPVWRVRNIFRCPKSVTQSDKPANWPGAQQVCATQPKRAGRRSGAGSRASHLVSGGRPRVASCKWRVASCTVQVSDCKLRVASRESQSEIRNLQSASGKAAIQEASSSEPPASHVSNRAKNINLVHTFGAPDAEIFLSLAPAGAASCWCSHRHTHTHTRSRLLPAPELGGRIAPPPPPPAGPPSEDRRKAIRTETQWSGAGG